MHNNSVVSSTKIHAARTNIFKGQNKWIKKEEEGKEDLWARFHKGMKVNPVEIMGEMHNWQSCFRQL